MRTEGEAEVILRELAELKEHQSWVHHVADAATGKLVTTQLSRPVSPLSRAERLSQLGHQFDPGIFGAPTYQLTPRFPYQASPQGFVRFVRAFSVDAEGSALWLPSEDIVGEKFGGIDAVLFQPPEGLCLLTLHLVTVKVPGAQAGRLRIEVLKSGGEVVASLQLADHRDGVHINTLDLVFVAVLTPFPSHGVQMRLEPGSDFRFVEFLELTLAGNIFFPPVVTR